MNLEHGKDRLIVFGTGEVSATPDQSVIQLGVETEGSLVETVQVENGEKMNQIISALQQLGVPANDIRTIEYQLIPMYDYQDGQQVFRSYRLTHIVQITLDQIDLTGEVVDAAVLNGANRVQSIQFTLQDEKAAYDEALLLAVADVTRKATVLTAEIGVHLDKVPIAIKELSAPVQPFTPRIHSFEASSQTPVQLGQLQVQANVEAVYEYRRSSE
ncbi:hypothetical protein AJ85_20215 [Alkalihalobacillus alcalophilus ATCC 27647 = CGMCC 1.3604]|uniref:DUF541 domain-containing protein n=2 Tax=Alkalihalobacillus alcalophilus TaxID=1445 RepID=A0A4S4JWE5_ALKAL|nr:SIMPL domain-containing protein [Alkalihalobacillus alcalophilus]MED1560433.1 SIMPL domain-containing protein [Alkalihalobacillus alcalophilus]THG88970.1 hypothetical protein AJ85_20215 [Alkalihalobacillus alcalophilus ATCC 27647 = CGMCC 1.3604]